MFETQSYIITIKQLCFNVLVGIYQHEQEIPQKLAMNLEINVDVPKNYLANHIDYESVFCYSDLVTKIEQHIKANQPIDLLENLASDVAKIIFENKNINGVKIELQKPDAIENADIVGICMVFSQK